MTLSVRMGHVIPSMHFGHDRHTDRHTREISIEHPSVGLASLAQLLEQWFPLHGKQAHSLKKCCFFKSNLNKIHPIFCSLFSRANMSFVVATIFFSSLAFLCSSSLHGQPEPFGSCSILQFCSSLFFCLHGQPELFASDHLLQS